MLEVENLTLKMGEKNILESVSFASMGNLGIIGKSGSGKSSLLKSLLMLLSPPFLLQAKVLRVSGCNVLHLNDRELRALRKRVGYVPADIYGSFYPLSDIGCVFDSLLAYHYPMMTKKARKQISLEMMERMGLENLDLIWHSYIRELSGGMARRVQLALCLVCGAEILLCDEVSASLDEENAQKIIKLLKEMRLPLVFVTHHLGHLKELCSEVLVMEKGRVIEHTSSTAFFDSPKSAYAQTLLGLREC